MKVLDNKEFEDLGKWGKVEKVKDFSAKGFAILYPFSPLSAESIAKGVMHLKGFISKSDYAVIHSSGSSDDHHDFTGSFYKFTSYDVKH